MGVLRDEFKRGDRLQDLLLRYTQAHLVQIAQTSVCNRLRTLGARLSRWLLMIHDRVAGDKFLLTQNVISTMLGAQRIGVSEAAGAPQGKGAIRYSRGQITILDRPGLEESSCECYWLIREEYDRLGGVRLPY